ncbi:hypothetical protein UFOVP454_27 [uncultured Caudovirales phage]|uniref:Uncharacterized protein n=1 Tax=uncultured Caudovirales phage TaxID=2100421 RepID=A0A6J5MCK2_9CAUD|nr:hypothetical protein UFOVP454_27 [uncultured Caudovirales phage]
MTIQHKLITDPDLHEPKGVAAAVTGKVYVSDGAGSGAWTYPSGRVHGEIYIDAGATTQTLSGSSAYAKLNPGTEWTSGVSNILTLTPGSGTITLVEAGSYMVHFWCGFTTTALASGTTYNFKYNLNGTSSPRTLSATKTTNGIDKLHVSATGLMTATAGQVLSIFVGGDGTSSGQNITVTEAGLTAVRL